MPDITAYKDLQDYFNTAQEDLLTTLGPIAAGVHSPGWLGLTYSATSGEQHKVQVRLTLHGDPYDYTQCLATANALAVGLGRMLPSDWLVDGFFAKNQQGQEVNAGLLAGPVVGSHPRTGDLDSYSYSVTCTGRGLGTDPTQLPGNELIRFFPQHGYPYDKGRKAIAIASDVDLLNGMVPFAVSQFAWADYWGMKASVRSLCPIQFNAHVQKRRGC